MALLVTYPCRDVANVFTRELSLGLPDTTPPGYSYVLSKEESKDLRIKGNPLTVLENGKAFFTAGLYSNSPIWLTRQWFKANPISHPVHIWELQRLEIEREDLSKGNKLKLSKKTWEKVSADQELRKQQRKKIRQLLKVDNGPPQKHCWAPPLTSKIVSKFASPRHLPNGKSYFHSGVDLRGWTGTPIKSPAKGKVVLAEHMIVPGNNIMLSHGGGIYSRYMHLNKMKVNVGDEVERGQILGTTGSTGRVEGPHLHWEVLWKSQHADPHQFISVWNQEC